MTTEIIKDVFEKIDYYLMNDRIKCILKISKSQLKDYNEFKKYCEENPNIIFEVINIIYSLLPNINYNNVINNLKIYFNDIEAINNVLNNHSHSLLYILNSKPNISNIFNKILKQQLINILKYHKIYKNGDRKKDIVYLITKEYTHRNKHNKFIYIKNGKRNNAEEEEEGGRRRRRRGGGGGGGRRYV